MIRCVTALILGAAVKSSGLYSRRGEEEEEEDEEEEEELEDEDEDEEEEEEEEEEERRIAEGSWGVQSSARTRVLRALRFFGVKLVDILKGSGGGGGWKRENEKDEF
jgi:hypothetical protein